MIAPARLLSVRLQGFKSFAERTHVEFGPGISAIVGPNGSGKSNLADALRWALGEQGRALRTRRAEDVIWAGSERRPAVGMADVQLSLDNGDGLLPVDFAVVELGRRLYRSGENEYLLNRGRVRLRDLVDLLDSAHLAENAFLFIGQGMVDQALALQPEERRPLFEEVAGVRRHERRRRRAEEQLVEAEANLARVEDILAELRPQARRLAAQAEQQTTREAAGEALAEALVRAAAARWYAAARRVSVENARLTSARETVDLAIAELAAAEEAAGAISRALAERSTESRRRRSMHDEAVAALTDARLAEGRLGAERESLERDRDRIAAETTVIEADLERDRRALAAPPPPRDVEAEAAAEAVAGALADALAEVAAAQAGSGAADDAAAANRREHAARTADLNAARRRLAVAEEVLGDERGRAVTTAECHATAEADHRRQLQAVERATARLSELAAAEAQALADVERATRVHAEAARRLLEAEGSARLAALALDEARARATNGPDPRLIATAERVGGRRLADGLDVEPRFQVAVEAALGDLVDGVELPAAAMADVGEAQGTVVVAERVAGGRVTGADGPIDVVRTRAEAELVREAEARGGGALATAVRRDPGGTVRFLLRRVVWLPDIDAGLALQSTLLPGWVAVTLGGVVVGDAAVRLAAGDGPLMAAAERLRLEAAVAAEEAALAAAAADTATSEAKVAQAAAALSVASEAARQAAIEERVASDAERLAFRTLEAALRESAWSAAQVTRLTADVERAANAVAALGEAPVGARDSAGEATSTVPAPSGSDRQALGAWEARAAELSARQHELSVAAAATVAARREDDAQRARAQASIALAEQRLVRLGADGAHVAERLTVIAREIDVVETGIDAARLAEEAARAELDALVDADADDRARLAALEAQAGTARQAVRRGDDAARAAERAELEARLGLDALRDAVLVDLAALGALGLRYLLAAAVAAGDSAGVPGIDGDEEIAELAFERALAAAGEVWAASEAVDEVPSAGRLGALRRRFHELGAPNPYATEEYRALADRLNQLETQDADLRAAITRTRDLIGELDVLIADQFRSTFQALEAAFDHRFRQMFGGGYARLSLTDPTDLAATGVDIVARPPGKKAQALAMLSGGERALTAVALLFAMLEVRPVPFCVLDEVDAALDEANIGRFTSALRELAAATQFIVITHNRGTIEMADALYGVTVGDDSVSRLISLRLDEARAIADDDQPAAVGVLAGEG